MKNLLCIGLTLLGLLFAAPDSRAENENDGYIYNFTPFIDTHLVFSPRFDETAFSLFYGLAYEPGKVPRITLNMNTSLESAFDLLGDPFQYEAVEITLSNSEIIRVSWEQSGGIHLNEDEKSVNLTIDLALDQCGSDMADAGNIAYFLKCFTSNDVVRIAILKDGSEVFSLGLTTRSALVYTRMVGILREKGDVDLLKLFGR